MIPHTRSTFVSRLKAAVERTARTASAGSMALQPSRLAEWAARHGMQSERGRAGVAVFRRSVEGLPWRIEIGPPTRDYIETCEFRSRTDLDLPGAVTVIVIDRALKEKLEDRAYSLIAGGEQTIAHPDLGEEMRWLACYQEFRWPGAPVEFWRRYAVLADRFENATAWLDEGFARQLLDVSRPPASPVPTVLALIRGRIYLRRQCEPADSGALDVVMRIVQVARERALREFATSAVKE